VKVCSNFTHTHPFNGLFARTRWVSALTLLVGQQEGPVRTERWGAGVVICLERGAGLHMTQLMPLPLTVSCFSKIQIGFTFLVPADLGSPGQRAVKRVCVCWSYLQSESKCCRPAPDLGSKPAAAASAVNRRDRQTDERTDGHGTVL